MLTLNDCIDLSELSSVEIAAIAEHEHLPEIVAAELGCNLVQTPAGRNVLKSYLHDNLLHAQACHKGEKAKELTKVLRQFDRAHPDPGEHRV